MITDYSYIPIDYGSEYVKTKGVRKIVIKTNQIDSDGDSYTPIYLQELADGIKENIPMHFLHPKDTIHQGILPYIDVKMLDKAHTVIGYTNNFQVIKVKNIYELICDFYGDPANEIYQYCEKLGLFDESSGWGYSTETWVDGQVKVGNRAVGAKEGALAGIALTPRPADVRTRTLYLCSSKDFLSTLDFTDAEWDKDRQETLIRDYTNSTTEPSATYSNFFLWVDSRNKDLYGAYKLPIVGIYNGKPTIFINAVNNAEARLSQTNISRDSREAILQIINNLQEKYKESLDEDSIIMQPMENPITEETKEPDLVSEEYLIQGLKMDLKALALKISEALKLGSKTEVIESMMQVVKHLVFSYRSERDITIMAESFGEGLFDNLSIESKSQNVEQKGLNTKPIKKEIRYIVK